jgi:hypothetical protein
MSNKIAEFKKLMTEKAKSQVPIQTEWVTVKSVNWDDKTMVGTGELNELDYEDVLLGLGAVYKKPKVGSLALVGKINNSAGCFLIDCEGYEEIELNSDITNLQVKKKGIRLKRNGEDLLSVMNDFEAEVLKTFTQNGMAFDPAKFTLIKQRLNAVLTSE